MAFKRRADNPLREALHRELCPGSIGGPFQGLAGARCLEFPKWSCRVTRRAMARARWLLGFALAAAALLVWSLLSRSGPDAGPADGVAAGAPLVPWGVGLPREGQWRNGFELVDMNGDGHLDVVHGPARKAAARAPHVFLGDGAGHFHEDTTARFPPLPYDYGDVAVADLDGDGALDLAVASHLQGLTVLLRRGDGFAPARLPDALASFSSRALAAADVNGDGDVDLVASSDGPRPFSRRPGTSGNESGVVVLLGGAAELRAEIPSSDATAFGDSLAIGQLDGAGGPEIITASGVIGADHLLYRRGTEGGFVLERLAGVPPDYLARVVAVLPDERAARVLLGGLVTGASGLEGTLDVVRVADGSATRLFRGVPLRAVSALGTGDLDADGKVDVVFGEEDGTLHVLAGTSAPEGSGFMTRGSLAAGAFAGCTPYGIALADLDGRAGDEVVVSFAGEGGACATGGGLEIYRAR